VRSRYLKVALSIVVEGDCLLTDIESNESMARLVTSMDVLNSCKLDWHILPLGFMTDSLQMVGSKRVDISYLYSVSHLGLPSEPYHLEIEGN
jgi:hypothetical protein